MDIFGGLFGSIVTAKHDTITSFFTSIAEPKKSPDSLSSKVALHSVVATTLSILFSRVLYKLMEYQLSNMKL